MIDIWRAAEQAIAQLASERKRREDVEAKANSLQAQVGKLTSQKEDLLARNSDL